MNPVNAVIVLGRGISENGELPESVKTATRKAISLVDEGVASTIIFSGKWSRHVTHTPSITEARAAFDYAIAQGMNPEVAVLEEESLDTLSNCYYIKKNILIPRKWHSALLLTMRENDERAEFLLKKMLGPTYSVEVLCLHFAFSTETLERLEQTEPEKVQKLTTF
jgi:uncharacterized SAM-binding protein YcdF (DUF218 family)